jgi:hypothetical protein
MEAQQQVILKEDEPTDILPFIDPMFIAHAGEKEALFLETQIKVKKGYRPIFDVDPLGLGGGLWNPRRHSNQPNVCVICGVAFCLYEKGTEILYIGALLNPKEENKIKRPLVLKKLCVILQPCS